MRIQKLLALLAALAILFTLSSCDWFTKNPDGNTTTAATTAAEPITLDPNRPMAPMEPLQGGPMLYTFYGSEAYTTYFSEYDGEEHPVYPIGLVDQDGKLVSAPVYHQADYIYDEAGQRVTGLAAVKDREITIYTLEGQSRALPCEGYRIEVFPGGRYAAVYTAEDFAWTGSSSSEDPLKEGIFDLQGNRFVVEPKAGQMIQYYGGGVAFGYQYDTADATGDETAQWAFKTAEEGTEESVIELPLSLGRIQQYFPETGWYGGMWAEKRGSDWTTGAYESRVYDNNFEVIPALSGWSVDYEGFGGGEWCMIYNNINDAGITTWVNRQGELSDKRYGDGVQASPGGQSYLIDGSYSNQATLLLKADLTEAFSLQAGEHFARMETLSANPRAMGGSHEGYFHLNGDRSVKAAYDLAGNPMRAPASFRCWWHLDDINNVGTAYAATGGQWAGLDLTQFFPTPKASHRGGVPYANPLVMCEDYIVLAAGVHWYEWGETYDTFAVDWQGNKIDDCPLAPFFGLLNYQTAGEQGPDYYWIAQEDGKRGYIDLRGNWLFIDPTE